MKYIINSEELCKLDTEQLIAFQDIIDTLTKPEYTKDIPKGGFRFGNMAVISANAKAH